MSGPHRPGKERGRRGLGEVLVAQRPTAAELLLVQLRRIGYSTAQLAALTGRPAESVSAALANAAQTLGARGEREAIEVALRCGLIV